MTPDPSPRDVPRHLGLFACLVLGAIVSVLLGQDANWDLRNYHIYNVHSVLAGRMDVDLLAAGLQTYFNPTLDFPYVMLAFGPLSEAPRVLAAAMGLWYGGLIYVAFRVAEVLLAGEPPPQRRMAATLGTLTAVTGAATLGQVGTTFNEIQIALLVLGGLLILLRGIASSPSGGRAPMRLPLGEAFGAGVLFGLAAGLKLTAGVYAPAACLALLAVARPVAWFRLCLMVSAGWLLGFLPPFLWWGLLVWERFGSPTFPLFNALFRSPWYPPENVFDARFFPRDAAQWIAYPWHWAFTTRADLATETPLRDPRLAMAWLAMVALGMVTLIGAAWRRTSQGPQAVAAGRRPGLGAPQRFALAFLVLGYVLWLVTSSILRYAVVLEILGVLCAIVAALALAHRLRWPPARLRWAAPGVAAVLAALCIPGTRIMDWGRAPYGPAVFSVDMSWVAPRTLFVAITGPSAYLAAFVPPELEARFLGFSFTTLIARDWRLGQESLAMVRAHDGPIMVLVSEVMMPFTEYLPAIGLSAQLGPCRAIRSNLDTNTTLACEGERIQAGGR
jgi:hypothetical protein